VLFEILVLFQLGFEKSLFPHVLEYSLQDTLGLEDGYLKIVHVELEGLGVLGIPHEEDIAIPEPSRGINFLNAQKSFDSLVLRKRVVFVPVEPVFAIPILTESIFATYVEIPPIELAHMPSVMEIRHIIMSILYQFVGR
jgi:hypothetical protein